MDNFPGLDQILYRWIHVIAGVLWIGILYFFNWINGAFQAQLDAETKRKVVPELMPRALFWFRWGAAFTWLSGVALLMSLYYAGPFALADGTKAAASVWGQAFAGLFVGFLLYDILFKVLGKSGAGHSAAVVLWGAIAIGFGCYLEYLGFSERAINIHIGALFGTSMAANVWMRIWPAQKRIIRAIKAGEKPLPADPAMAGLRSKHNTYMSVPLLLLMVSVNQDDLLAWETPWQYVVGAIFVVGFLMTYAIYKSVPKVKGF